MQHGKLILSIILFSCLLGLGATPARASSCTVECEVPWWQFWRDCGEMDVECSGSLFCTDGQCGELDGRARCFGGNAGNWSARLFCGELEPGAPDTKRIPAGSHWDLLRGETDGWATVLASSGLERAGRPVASDLEPGDLELAVRPACDPSGETVRPRLLGVDIPNRAAADWPEQAEGAYALLLLNVDGSGRVLDSTTLYEADSEAAGWLVRHVPRSAIVHLDTTRSAPVEVLLFVRLEAGHRIDHAAAIVR